jgi:hypothetical protein
VKPKIPPYEEHPDVLRARAEERTQAVALAATYEGKGADAGILRLILTQRAKEAWKVYQQRTDPLGAPEAPGQEAAPAASILPPSGAPSGRHLRPL